MLKDKVAKKQGRLLIYPYYSRGTFNINFTIKKIAEHIIFKNVLKIPNI